MTFVGATLVAGASGFTAGGVVAFILGFGLRRPWLSFWQDCSAQLSRPAARRRGRRRPPASLAGFLVELVLSLRQ
jgi:hypothetical protein